MRLLLVNSLLWDLCFYLVSIPLPCSTRCQTFNKQLVDRLQDQSSKVSKKKLKVNLIIEC